MADSTEARQNLFSQFVKDQLTHPTYDDQLIDKIKAFGDASFLESVQLKSGVPLTKRPKGRPKKPPPNIEK